MSRRLQSNWHILIPCLLLASYAAPILGLLLPNVGDELTESYEPVKTLMFVYTHGTAFHKWGPLPSIVYAPFYAPFLGYWYVTGDLTKPGTSFLASFKHPFEELGTLILVARLVGLAAGLVAVGIYSRSLARACQSRLAALLAIVLCVATAPDLIYEFAVTKPDGLMMAGLALATAVYSLILAEGFTVRRGVLLSLAAVASVSCKEQAASAFAAMFACIFLMNLPLRRQFLRDYGTALLVGIGAYCIVNVIYAPGTWLAHIKFWTIGAGKDPTVWAASGYTRVQYIHDGIKNILFNLGPGGTLAVSGAILGSFFYRSKALAGAWAPLVVYLAVIFATAGYMPRYFFLPVTILAALPVALVLAGLELSWATRPPLRIAVAALLCIAVGLNLWDANIAWAQARQRPEWMIEYAAQGIPKAQSINLANPWRVAAGSSRLAYLGYRVDDRPLGALMQHPGDLPDYVLISRVWENWMLDFKRRPARNDLYNQTGYSYASFEGIRPLGYELVKTLHPPVPGFLQPALALWPPNITEDVTNDLLVYRRLSPTR